MPSFLVVLVVMIIFVAIGVIVYSGILLVSTSLDDLKFDTTQISSLISKTNNTNFNETKDYDETRRPETKSEIESANATSWSIIYSVPSGEYHSVSALCKNGYEAVSGGIKITLGNFTMIDSNSMGNHGWSVSVKNTGMSEGAYMVYVNCILRGK